MDESLFVNGRAQFFFFWNKVQEAWRDAATEAWSSVVQDPTVKGLELTKFHDVSNSLCYSLDGPNGEPGVVQNYPFFIELTVASATGTVGAKAKTISPPIDFRQVLVSVINSNQEELVARIRESAKIQDSRFSLRLQNIAGVVALDLTEEDVEEVIKNENEKTCLMDTCDYSSSDLGCAHEGIGSPAAMEESENGNIGDSA